MLSTNVFITFEKPQFRAILLFRPSYHFQTFLPVFPNGKKILNIARWTRKRIPHCPGFVVTFLRTFRHRMEVISSNHFSSAEAKHLICAKDERVNGTVGVKKYIDERLKMILIGER